MLDLFDLLQCCLLAHIAFGKELSFSAFKLKASFPPLQLDTHLIDKVDICSVFGQPESCQILSGYKSIEKYQLTFNVNQL
jgi:hypothetical protein